MPDRATETITREELDQILERNRRETLENCQQLMEVVLALQRKQEVSSGELVAVARFLAKGGTRGRSIYNGFLDDETAWGHVYQSLVDKWLNDPANRNEAGDRLTALRQPQEIIFKELTDREESRLR